MTIKCHICGCVSSVTVLCVSVVELSQSVCVYVCAEKVNASVDGG